MNILLFPVLLALFASTSGDGVKSQQPSDSEVAGSHQAWATVGYGGHPAHITEQARAKEVAQWRAREFANVKALADQQAAIAAWKANVAAEEQKKASEVQAEAHAKTLADEKVVDAQWKVKLAVEEERKALVAAEEAELMGKEANLAATAAKEAAEEVNKAYLEAQARADQEADLASEKAKFAEERRQQASLSSEAKALAIEAATLAQHKARSAEDAFWKAKQAASYW